MTTKSIISEVSASKYVLVGDTENDINEIIVDETFESGGGVHHVPSTDLVSGKLDSKQDKLTAGNNISISEDGVIESIGWTGTADIKTEFSDLDPSTDLEVPSAKLVESGFKKIWNGYGIYKNPTTGRLEIYKPLPQSADGSIKIVKDYGMVLKVAPVEEADDTAVFCGWAMYGNNRHDVLQKWLNRG